MKWSRDELTGRRRRGRDGEFENSKNQEALCVVSCSTSGQGGINYGACLGGSWKTTLSALNLGFLCLLGRPGTDLYLVGS